MSRVLRGAALDTAPRIVGDADSVYATEVRAMLDSATQEAFSRGREEGFGAGYEAAAQNLGNFSDAIARSIEEGIAAVKRWRAEDGVHVVELALAIAEGVIGAEPRAGGAAVAERVRAALGAIDDGPLTLLVHPEDVEPVRAALAELDLSVAADPTVAMGDARVRGPWSELELTTQTAWAAVREALASE